MIINIIIIIIITITITTHLPLGMVVAGVLVWLSSRSPRLVVLFAGVHHDTCSPVGLRGTWPHQARV